jgi:hypothetical protein
MSRKANTLLAANWRLSAVRRCMWKKDRESVIRFIRERHQERFFKPIKLLGKAKGNPQGHGFAMMSLCSLLVETIQSYREGLPTTHGPELNHFRTFKRVPPTYQFPPNLQVNGVGRFRLFFHDFRKELGGINGERFLQKRPQWIAPSSANKGRMEDQHGKAAAILQKNR